MNLWQRYLFGMLSGAGSVVIKMGLNMLVIPILIADLGLDAFGLYILLLGLFELALLLDLGVSNALVKLLSGEEDAHYGRKAYLKVGHSLFALLALLFLLGGLTLMPWFDAIFHIPPALADIAPVALTLIVVEAALNIYSCYYQSVLLAHCSHQWSNTADTLYNLVANLGALILLTLGFNLPEIMAARLFGGILRLGLMMIQALKLEPQLLKPQIPFSLPALKEMMHLSFHGMMINLSIIISHKIDVIIIGLFLPIGAVGIYELVFRFLGIVVQICLKLSEGAFPLLAKMAIQREVTAARQLFLRMSCLLNFVACMLMMLIISNYGDLLEIFSAHRVTLSETLPLLMVAAPIMLSGVLQMMAGNWLFTWGHSKYLTVSSLLTALANLVLSLILVQFLGLIGVALGTLIPQLIQHQGGLIRKTCRELSISFRRYVSTVHGSVVLPLAISILWVQLWKPVVSASAFKLLPIGLVAFGAILIGAGLWFWMTATPLEWKIFSDKILTPLQLKIRPPHIAHALQQPLQGEVSHG